MQNLDNKPSNQPANLEVSEAATYRIGGVAKLVDVPVPTLRVWETRHGAFTPSASAGGHRLYNGVDVMRARLIRQLSTAGHSLGSIARLPLADLQRLQNASAPAPTAAPAIAVAPVSIMAVGQAVAVRLASSAWRMRSGARPTEMREGFSDLDALLQAASERTLPEADILLVRLNAIQPATAGQLAQATARVRVNHVVVLYNFAAEPVLASLRVAGVTLRREPVSDAELVDLFDSVTVVDTGHAAAFGPRASVPPRRFSDGLLAQVAAAPTEVMCECPRHIAELIAQLASFEEYSGQCLETSKEDAQLHAYLRSISGSARALFEHALQTVLDHGGVALAPDLPLV